MGSARSNRSTAVGCSPTAVRYPPTAVGCPPNAVSHRPTPLFTAENDGVSLIFLPFCFVKLGSTLFFRGSEGSVAATV